MKQLLRSLNEDSQPSTLVVGLGNVALSLQLGEDGSVQQFVELQPRRGLQTTDRKDDMNDDEEMNNEKQPIAEEKPQEETKSGKTEDNPEKEGKPVEAENGQPVLTDNIDPLEIQAVAIMKSPSDGKIWYAVARLDKSLCLYCIDPSSEDIVKKPTTIHFTNKRVWSLCFANVGSLSVVITGDVAGDAWSFSLTNSSKDGSNSRLLLGHTASMLSAVDVIDNRLLITADRDEKLRISPFPNTHLIEAYLLGHGEFISCFQVSPDRNTMGSGSGDKTLRLWNMKSFKEIARYEATARLNETDTQLIPVQIVWDSGSKFMLVAYDSCNFIDVVEVTETKFRQRQRFECQSQPLGLSWFQLDGSGSIFLCVITRDPTFAQICRFERDQAEPLIVQDDHPLPKSLHGLDGTKFRKMTMPLNLLERDPYGNIKMSKLSETRGPQDDYADMPWNKSERKELANERNRRSKKRRRERARQEASEIGEAES